jgi:hypothetical protein
MKVRPLIVPKLALIGTVFLLLPAATPASQWPRQCRQDVTRTCRTVLEQGDHVILSCLQENVKTISSGCRKLLQSYGHVPKQGSR